MTGKCDPVKVAHINLPVDVSAIQIVDGKCDDDPANEPMLPSDGRIGFHSIGIQKRAASLGDVTHIRVLGGDGQVQRMCETPG